MTRTHKDLTQGSIPGQLFSLSMPMFFGLFAIFFFGVTDAYFLGKLGAQELAAMGYILPILALFMSLSRGMSEGAISLVSRKFGANDMDDAKLFSTSILVFCLVLALGFVCLGLLGMEYALDFLGATGRVKALAREYLAIWFGGMFFLVIPIVGNGFIRAAGDTRWPAMLMVFAAIGNIILDPIFIFGLGPIPAMGMKGAAVASITSRSFTLVASLYLVHYKYQLLCFERWNMSKVIQIWKNFLTVSVPASLNFLIIPFTIAMITKLMANYSDNHVAGFGLAHQIETLSLLAFYAIAVGLSSFVGQNYGARQYTRLQEVFSVATKANLLIGVFLIVLFFTVSRPISALFQDDPIIVEIASQYLMVVSISYAFEGIYLCSVNALNVAGKALYATLLVIMRMFVLYIPLAYGLAGLIGHKAVFFAACISNIGAGLLGRYLIQKYIAQPNS